MLRFILWTCFLYTSIQRGFAQGSSNTDQGGGKIPPLELEVKLGSDVILQCDAVKLGQNSLLLEWRKNGSKSAIFMKFMDFTPRIDPRYSRRLHMINSSAILLSSAKESDAGIYRCKTMQSATESAVINHGRWIVLKVTGKVGLPSRRKTVVETYPAVLDCMTDKDLPTETVDYSWTKDGSDALTSVGATILASGALFIQDTRRAYIGVYQCTARTVDSTGLVSYAGVKTFLDVQYAPEIKNISQVVAVAEGSDARLPCFADANPATEFTNWTRHRKDVRSARFAVLEKGALLIQDVRRTDAGEYSCTPYNKVGAGKTKKTKLVLKDVPRFIIAPPSIMTFRVDDDVTLDCRATSDSPVTLSWEREGSPLPKDRSVVKNGKLTIRRIQKDDYGIYTCIASSNDGKARQSTTLAVISTPSKPSITSVTFNGSTVVVRWRPGYDGGYPQKMEVWYRLFSDDDYKWSYSPRLSASVTSYRIPGLQAGKPYLFSVRGVNREGLGPFSEMVEAKGLPPELNRDPKKSDKPLPPESVTLNITRDGYLVSWRYKDVPGRPSVEKFVIEYREGNHSSTWFRADDNVPAERKDYLFSAKLAEADKSYDFRVSSCDATKCSEPAYVTVTYKIASPVFGASSSRSNIYRIIGGVLGAICAVLLIALFCFCCYRKRKRDKLSINQSGSKKVQFILPRSEGTEPEESEEDFLDAEIKLLPEAVRFVPDHNDTSYPYEKYAKMKREEDFLLMGHGGCYGGDMLRRSNVVNSASAGHSPELSLDSEKVRFFGDFETRDGQSAWYDCSLGKPASREVRDSFDQFCRADIGSKDSIHRSPTGSNGRKSSQDQIGSKGAPKFGSNVSLPEGKATNGNFRNSRFTPIKEESPRERDVPRGKGTLGRRQPHHWSSPAVYSKRQDTNNNSDGKNSDSDSGDSSSRGRTRRHRPHSLYEGKLRPISEQDADGKLRCTCDADEESDDYANYPTLKLGEGGAPLTSESSSYLHLDRSDTLKRPFPNRSKEWNEPTPGEPYASHRHRKPLDTDSENSISPAISLATLSETESDQEIARKLYGSRSSETTNGAVAATLPRAVKKLKSNDSESSSDEHGLQRSRDRSRKSSPPVYKVKKPASVTDLELKPVDRLDSMELLKACDPYFKNSNPVSRSSSNASSGIGSVPVSSCETNSIESPRERRPRFSSRTSLDRASSGYNSPRESLRSSSLRPSQMSTSARSSVSSDRTSTDRTSSGYTSSRDSYENTECLRPEDYSKAHAQMRLSGKGRRSDETYDLDPSSHDLHEVETEGSAYDPKVFEEIIAMQQAMGVNLDGSDSSRESLKEMAKLSNSEMMTYSPSMSPSKFKVDLYSDEEKDQRCTKLMAEYKTNKKLQDVKARPGSQIYRTWDL
ncbi:uncharacterized protein [Acropora muricata]|uniref:uncharacterized protein isoform X2 n=1 Tax=Acropora muricata TaxID=159855 RepID=UPI0034E5E3A6